MIIRLTLIIVMILLFLISGVLAKVVYQGRNAKQIALTFDDGPTAGVTDKILDVLKKEKEILKRTIAESKRKYWILKPFRGTRGRGVIVLTKDSMKNINSLLDFYIGSEDDERVPKNYIILQEYLPKAEKGDKRILLLNERDIGAFEN